MKQKAITIILLCIALGIATILTIQHPSPTEEIHEPSQPLQSVTDAKPIPTPPIPESPPPPQPTTPAHQPITAFAPFTSYVYHNTRLRMPLSADLQEHTYRMSQTYDVPYRVIMGLMGVESGWNANIGTKTNAGTTYVGLGMLRDIYYAEQYAAKGIDIYTPKGNIEAICISFKIKLDEFDGNIHHALMAYNLGNGGARSKIKSGINDTGYSRKVLAYADSFM